MCVKCRMPNHANSYIVCSYWLLSTICIAELMQDVMLFCVARCLKITRYRSVVGHGGHFKLVGSNGSLEMYMLQL